MTHEQLLEIEATLTERFEQDIEYLRQSFIDSSARFKVGDFVRNITGIIKIESIRYDRYSDDWIAYCGVKYRYNDRGKLSPVSKTQKCMSEPLQKIESPIVED